MQLPWCLSLDFSGESNVECCSKVRPLTLGRPKIINNLGLLCLLATTEDTFETASDYTLNFELIS